MNFYEKEMRSLFEHNDIIQDPKFCGKMMLGKLDDDLRVKLEFISTFIFYDESCFSAPDEGIEESLGGMQCQIEEKKQAHGLKMG